jgi:hypothetical protein
MTEPLVYSAVANCAPASKTAVHEVFILASECQNNRPKKTMPNLHTQHPWPLFKLWITSRKPTQNPADAHQQTVVRGCHVGGCQVE